MEKLPYYIANKDTWDPNHIVDLKNYEEGYTLLRSTFSMGDNSP